MRLNASPAVSWYLALPCAGGGGLLLLLAMGKASGLAQGGGLPVALLLLLLALSAVFFLWRYESGLSVLCVCVLPVGLAFFLRALCLDHMTYDYQDFLAVWAAFFRDNGGFAAIQLPKGNYNVPYLYFLAAISYIRLPDFYLIKLFSILFDVLLAWGGMRLVCRFCTAESRRPLVVFCVLLLLPTVVLNGAYWGQCDSIYAALVLHALASALGKRPAGSVVLLALGFAFKLQTVFLIPLWCAFWFVKKVRFRDLLLFPAVNIIVALPALALGKPGWDILRIYLGQLGEYSEELTLNAPSVYALLPYGLEVDVPRLAAVGIALAFLLVLALLAVLFVRQHRITDETLLAAAVILAVGVPLLLPHMHERYFMLAEVLTVVWATVNLGRILIPAAVQFAALGGYHAYLVLRYAFPMAWGAWILLAVLVAMWVQFMHTFQARVPGAREAHPAAQWQD